MPHKGHLTHFGRTIRKNKTFNQSILHVSVDEAHVIASPGMPGNNGKSATRPAYNRLDSFRVLLSNSTSFSTLSATVSPYVDTIISKKLALHSNTVKLCDSLNRPNMTYATIDMVDSLANFNNLNFLVPQHYHPPMLQQPTIVFFDTQNMARDGARYINSRYPAALQELHFCRHYHSDMSAEYLQQTYDDFISESDNCLILYATRGASTTSGLLYNKYLSTHEIILTIGH
jgi:superfamily II DNA helicase RecQ